MKEPSAAVSEAVYQKLINAAGVTALVGSSPARIWDKVPAAPAYPFIRLGDDQAVGDSNGCFDAWEFYVTVHIFSRHEQYPRLEAKDIANQVAIAIGNNASLIAPAGFVVTEVELVQSRPIMEADGVTAHQVMTFKYRVADGT